MVISHNILAMNGDRMLGCATWKKKKLSEKLASGYRINRGADDAAGLAISEKMRRQIRGLKKGTENIMDGISLLQVADGALQEVHHILQRMNELVVKAANGTYTNSDRSAIQREIDALSTEIDRIGQTTEFNTRKVFQNDWGEAGGDGTAGSSGITVHVKGKPLDNSITSYTIGGDENSGISVNGTTFAWADIKDSNGDSLAAGIKDGTYSFVYNGLTFDVQVSSKSTFNDIAAQVDGLSFNTSNNTKINNMTFSTKQVPSLFYVWDEYNYVNLNHSGICDIRADDRGITITNRITNASTYIDFNSIGGAYTDTYESLMQDGKLTSLTFEIEDSQFDLTINLDSGWTKEDVINGLNGTSFETNFTGNVEDFITSISTESYLEASGFYCNFSKDFYIANGCDLSKLNIENAFEGNFIQSATDKYSFSIKLDKDGHTNMFTLDAASRARLMEIDNRGCTPGEIISLSFTDMNGNNIVAEFRAKSSFNYATFTNTLSNRTNFSNTGHSIYAYGDIKGGASNDYDILLKKDGDDAQNGDLNGNGIIIQCSGDSSDYIVLRIGLMDAEKIGVDKVSALTANGARNAIDSISSAIELISRQRTKIGGQQNRLSHAYNINENTTENTQSAESQIRDVNMAELMVEYANKEIIMNAALSMLAQANKSHQYVLSLLS